MLHTPSLSRLLTSLIVTVLVVLTLALPAAAKSRKVQKGKAVASHSKSKSGKQARASRGKSSRRELARRSKRGRHRVVRTDEMDGYELAANQPTVPDHIEVVEYGSTNSADLSKWLNPPLPRNQTSSNSGETDVVTPTRGKKVNIDSERVIQIQQALSKRGFYSGETTGVYDETTVDAMRRFQISGKIAVTGYPTAHSLKRLGLGNW